MISCVVVVVVVVDISPKKVAATCKVHPIKFSVRCIFGTLIAMQLVFVIVYTLICINPYIAKS